MILVILLLVFIGNSQFLEINEINK